MHFRLVTGYSAGRLRSMADVQEKDGKAVRHQYGFYTCKLHLDGLARWGIRYLMYISCMMESEKCLKSSLAPAWAIIGKQ